MNPFLALKLYLFAKADPHGRLEFFVGELLLGQRAGRVRESIEHYESDIDYESCG